MRYRFLKFPGGKTKAVTFSYDDGCKDDLRLVQTLNKYNLKGTFNLNNFKLRGNGGISDENIKEYILNKGHEVAVHGAMHRAEGALRPIEMMRDIIDNRLELESRFGGIIRGMAYPDFGIGKMMNGAEYDKIKEILSDLDISYSRTLGGDNNSFSLPSDWHAWMPTAHHDNEKIFDYINEFINIDTENCYISMCYPRLFYIWGHSYEFENNNNWDRLEKICEELSGREDIWYATNMEIYSYVKAYESLSYSADEKTVYNPTLFEIYFVVDGKMYNIKPGETLNIE